MKTRTLAIVALILSTLGSGISKAAERVDLRTAIEKLQATLQAVPAFTSDSSRTYSMTPEYHEANHTTPAERPGHTITQNTILAGKCFRLSSKSISNTGVLYWDQDIAYDGQQLQKLDRFRETMSIWRKTTFDVYSSSGTPLDQFGFIAAFTPTGDRMLKFEDLKSSAVWSKILGKAKSLGYRKLDGADVLSFELRDVVDPDGPVACRYVVSLSPAHGFFPVRWASYTSNGGLFQEFKVTEFEKATFSDINYYYFKTAVRKYNGVEKFARVTLITQDCVTSSLEIAPVDEAAFIINPAPARDIVDQDTNTVTAVPR